MRNRSIRMSKYTDGGVYTVLARLIQTMALWARTEDKVWQKVAVMANWKMDKISELKTKAAEIAQGNLTDIRWLQQNDKHINLMMALAKENTTTSYGWRRNKQITIGKNLEKAEYGAFRWFTSEDLRAHPTWDSVRNQE